MYQLPLFKRFSYHDIMLQTSIPAYENSKMWLIPSPHKISIYFRSFNTITDSLCACYACQSCLGLFLRLISTFIIEHFPTLITYSGLPDINKLALWCMAQCVGIVLHTVSSFSLEQTNYMSTNAIAGSIHETAVRGVQVSLTKLFLQNVSPLQWRHNEGDGVSNHQPLYCLLNRLFRRRSKKTS